MLKGVPLLRNAQNKENQVCYCNNANLTYVTPNIRILFTFEHNINPTESAFKTKLHY